ncbi:hypothetical protein BX666DRAFT_807347 [Dichotomocladium elegans]|nr:hypothetical protein BX666DRAFT_807347 [Dichotomocladium elegans]
MLVCIQLLPLTFNMLHAAAEALPNTIYELVFESLSSRPYPDTEPILIDAHNIDRGLSFEAIKAHTRTLASALRSAPYNLNEGDVIALCSPNDIEYVTAFHGIMAAGCSVCLVPKILSTSEITGLFALAAPKAVIAHVDVLDKVIAAMHAKGYQAPIWTIGSAADSTFTPLSDIYLKGPHDVVLPKVDPNTPAFFVCTSGSSGPRKLVTITQRIGVLRAQETLKYFPNVSISARAITGNHFAYAYSVAINMVTFVQLGLRQYVVEPDDLSGLLQLIERHKITQAPFSPWAVTQIAHHPEMISMYDISSLKFVSSGGQAIRPDVQRLFLKHMNLAAFVVHYGSTEAFSPFAAIRDEPREACGRLRQEREFHVKLVDDHGKEVPEGKEGELWVKHPMLAKGYFNDPAKTAQAFDKDGYYHTSDIFTMNDKGEFYFLGRKSDTIKTQYRYFASRCVEDVIMTYDGIKECAVVGAFSTKHCYEFPRAYIVLRDTDAVGAFSPAAFIDYVDERVPEKFMHLDGGVEVLEQLPRTSVGKIDLFSLRALAQQAIEQRMQ